MVKRVVDYPKSTCNVSKIGKMTPNDSPKCGIQYKAREHIFKLSFITLRIRPGAVVTVVAVVAGAQ